MENDAFTIGAKIKFLRLVGRGAGAGLRRARDLERGKKTIAAREKGARS